MALPLSSKIFAIVISLYVTIMLSSTENGSYPPEEKKAKSDQIKLDLKSPVCIILASREQEDN